MPAQDPLAAARRVCRSCVEVAGVSGAGVSLMVSDGRGGSICASDARAEQVEELQFELGEGPCVDAYRDGVPVLEPVLACSQRWPGFGDAARAAGFEAVFSFPIHIGAARLGALDLSRDRPGPLGDDAFASVLTIAASLAQLVVRVLARIPVGALPGGLERLEEHRAQVHQATGMVSFQLDVSLADALVRLRAHAFAHDRALVDVAAEVMAHTLRLER